MIGRLTGNLIEKSAESVLLDVNGVGYELTCPLTVIEQLPSLNERCSLCVQTRVREDRITLFGFQSSEERGLFRALTSVSGIGPRLAIACMSGLDAEALQRAIITGDTKRLSSVPGIGKRSAERIILELRPRFEKLSVLREANPNAEQLQDLESALVNLGYKKKDIDQFISELGARAEDLSFEELLREALHRFTF